MAEALADQGVVSQLTTREFLETFLPEETLEFNTTVQVAYFFLM